VAAERIFPMVPAISGPVSGDLPHGTGGSRP
jgi:hypothetical protein